MNRRSYLTEEKVRHAPTAIPCRAPVPPSISNNEALRRLFEEQESERHRMRMEHMVERERMCLAAEQEVLRVHARMARCVANQPLPFSVCTFLKYEEVYNALELEGEAPPEKSSSGSSGSSSSGGIFGNDFYYPPTGTGASKDKSGDNGSFSSLFKGDRSGGLGDPNSTNGNRTRYNGRLFLSWLRDVDDKWEKIKEVTLARQHKEAESMHAIQRLHWEWKLKELGICDVRSTPSIDESCVPQVSVVDDFDLLPA